jgi:hypothetical protein
MLELTFPSDVYKDNRPDPARLRRLRKNARARGFRVLRGHPGWSLINARIEPQRALCGLSDVSFEAIEAALAVPLPPRKRRRSFNFPVRRRADRPGVAALVEIGGAS